MNNNKLLPSKAICPKCKSKNLIITEIAETNIIWNQVNGYIDIDDGIQESGSIIGIYGQCDDCNHKWKLRCLQVTDLTRGNYNGYKY